MVGSLPTSCPRTHLTSLIGREAEIADLKHRLARTRLLMLSSAGGLGKTLLRGWRLQFELARPRVVRP